MPLILTTPHKDQSKEPIQKIILWLTMHEQWEKNATYQINFTVIDIGLPIYDQLDVESHIFLNDQEYVVKDCVENFDSHTKEIKAWHVYNEISRIYLRADLNKQNVSSSSDNQNAQQQEPSYSIEDILKMYLDGNQLGFSYEINGNFDKKKVSGIDSGSGKEMLSKICEAWPDAIVNPDNKKIVVEQDSRFYKDEGRMLNFPGDLKSMKTTRNSQDIINQIRCVGGKRTVQITNGDGGNLDSVEGFCKSAINSSFGVNKDQMCQDFANRSQRVHAWGVDVNRLYDTVKNAGVSPEWFFAYELQEQGSGWGWLNHTYRHGDAYQDAQSVCEWIKQCSYSENINPAWSAPEGSMAPNPGLQAKWNQEFGKGSIGRCYLQGTAAAVWDLAGVTPNPAIGKPITGCVNTIKRWGGHTVSGSASLSAFLKQYVGKAPYVLGGNDPATGWDCSGLVNYTLKHFGVALPSARPVTTTLETMGPVVGPPYQAGDLLFWGSRGHSYHVSIAIDSEWRIGADNENSGTVQMKIAQWPPSFAVRVAAFQKAISGGGDSNGNSSYEAYYFPPFMVQDDASVKEWGPHPGPDLVDDSFTDPEAMRKYALTTLKPNPSLTIEVSLKDNSFIPKKGEILRVEAIDKKYAGKWRTVGYDMYPKGGTNSTTGITLNNSKQTILDYQNQKTNIIQRALEEQQSRLRGVASSLDQQSQTLTHVVNKQDESSSDRAPELTVSEMKKLTELTEGGGSNG